MALILLFRFIDFRNGGLIRKLCSSFQLTFRKYGCFRTDVGSPRAAGLRSSKISIRSFAGWFLGINYG